MKGYIFISESVSEGRPDKVTRLHLKKLQVFHEELIKEQTEYIGVNIDGPFKPDYYRHY